MSLQDVIYCLSSSTATCKIEKNLMEENYNNCLVCLCGGLGTRLRQSFDGPKILAPLFFEKIVAIELIISWAFASKFNQLIFLAGYEGEQVEHYVSRRNLEWCSVFVEKQPIGTAHAITEFFRFLPHKFFLINGDTIFSKPLNFKKNTQHNILFGVKMSDPRRFGTVEVKHGLVSGFSEKKNVKFAGLVSSGLTRLNLEDILELGAVSLEREVYPRLVRERKLRFEQLDGKFLDYGTPESYLGINSIRASAYLEYDLLTY